MNKNSYIKKHIEFNKDELETEVWVDIKGYDYEYQISNLGRFKSKTAFHSNLIDKTRLGSFNKNGYLRVNLTKKGKPINKKIHRLVAEHFLIDYDETLTVNHKDFVKNNNRVSNIEMMTSAENITDYISKVKKITSSSNHIGVTFHKGINKWVSSVNEEGNSISLGSYEKEECAINAIKLYKKGKLKPFKKLGGIKSTEDKVKDVIYLSTKTDLINVARLTKLSVITVTKYIEKFKEIDLNEYVPQSDWEEISFFKHNKGEENHRYIERVGRVFYKDDGSNFTIIESYKNRCTIKFNDGTIVKDLNYDILRRKRVSNPNAPTKSGIGFIGQGSYNTKSKNAYKAWENLLVRVKKGDIVIEEQWYNFQNFAKFFTNKFKGVDTFGLRICSDDIRGNTLHINAKSIYLLSTSQYNIKYKTLKQYK